MELDMTDDWLLQARRVVSPNVDDRPPGVSPSLVVIHGISLPPGEYGGDSIDRLFTNQLAGETHPYLKGICHLRVSSHLLIRRDGELVQYAPLSKRAWHAGASSFDGRFGCNDFSIGIELEGVDEHAYEDAQYEVLTVVLQLMMTTWPVITTTRIVGHEHISPGRKTDPGIAFDWLRLRESLNRS